MGRKNGADAAGGTLFLASHLPKHRDICLMSYDSRLLIKLMIFVFATLPGIVIMIMLMR